MSVKAKNGISDQTDSNDEGVFKQDVNCIFDLVKPTSSAEKPRCMINTMAAAITVHNMEVAKKSKAGAPSPDYQVDLDNHQRTGFGLLSSLPHQ